MKEKVTHEEAVERLLKEAMNKDIPSQVEQRLRRRLAMFRRQLAASGPERQPPGFLARRRNRLGWVMAVVVIFLGVGFYYITSNPEPTWADVLERITTVSSLQATIYVRTGVSAPPGMLEVWMDYGGKLRLHAGNKVAFGDNGRFIEEIPIGPPTDPSLGLAIAEETVQFLITKMGRMDTFSFDVLLRMFPDELSHLSNPLRLQEPTISRDIVLFDITSEDSPEWIRVWTLRESCLPIRVLHWDPRSAQTTDVLLSYGNRQSPEFYDPIEFKKQIAACVKPADRAYALIQDRAGRPMTPMDVHALTEAIPQEETSIDKS